MQQVQNLQHKRLQQALSSVAELNVQIVELKKRLEDVDAKNREISANIRHINGGGSPDTNQTPPLCNSLNTEDPNNSITVTPTSTVSSPSTLCENPADIMEITKNKRRIDDVGPSPVTPIDVAIDIVNSLEDCDLPCSSLKKPKFDA